MRNTHPNNTINTIVILKTTNTDNTNFEYKYYV